MKLELKHLAPYLPYGLKLNTTENEMYLIDFKNKEIESLFRGNLINIYEWDEIKPILRPMSGLTTHIDKLGFIPLIEILRLIESNHFSKDKILVSCCKDFKPKVIECFSKNYTENHTEHTVKFLIKTSNMGDLVYSFGYSEHFNRFQKIDETRKMTLGVGHQMELFQKLYEWHFDVFGLIGAGLAIDINTVPELLNG